MAKSGQLQLLTGIAPGVEPLADSVVFTESSPASLGSIVADLLDKSDSGLRIAVDYVNRKIYAFPIATDVAALLASDAMKQVGAVTRDDATKRSSPVTLAPVDDISASAVLTDLQGAVSASYAASKPAKNVAAIVNSVEDALAAINANGTEPVAGCVVLVDQTGDGSVSIYADEVNPIVITPTGATAKLQQVIAPTTSGPAPLAFE